jgi:hypothetical protein
MWSNLYVNYIKKLIIIIIINTYLNYNLFILHLHFIVFAFIIITIDAPPSSLMDSTMNPKLKTMEREGVRVHSLVYNTSGVKGCAGVPRWGLSKLTSKSITHMNLHKPNNKLVNA